MNYIILFLIIYIDTYYLLYKLFVGKLQKIVLVLSSLRGLGINISS